jgi:membrane protein DedA with SNARE-associated domain
MNGYQFIASLVGSLAWPAVVAVLLYLLRKQLTSPANSTTLSYERCR